MRRGSRAKRSGRGLRVARVLVVVVVALGLVTGLSATFLYRHLNGNLRVEPIPPELNPDRPPDVEVAGPTQPLDVLVMGSDSRDCEGCGIDKESGGGSDTTILFHLAADRQSAYGVSIPRDSLVDRPDCFTEDGETIPGGTAQIWNAAYALGGPACTVRQVEQVTGVHVDNYVVVDFHGFQDMVDAVGGVEVCVREDLDSTKADIHIPAGTHRLDGAEALDYIRIRQGVGDGTDLGRIRRQQAFIASLADEVMSSGTLARPDRLVRFLNAATKSLKTDLPSIRALASLALEVEDIGPQRIRFLTVPWTYSTAQPGRVEWQPTAPLLWDRLAHDEPLGSLRDGSIPVAPAPSAPAAPPTPAPAAPAPEELADAGLCS